MSAKHTPRPWIVEHDEFAGYDCMWGAWVVSSAAAPHFTGRIVAVECGKDEEHHTEAEANARLIAAAPELLQACKDVRDWLLDTKPMRDDGLMHPGFIKANNAVNAAIAKAKPAESRLPSRPNQEKLWRCEGRYPVPLPRSDGPREYRCSRPKGHAGDCGARQPGEPPTVAESPSRETARLSR